MSRPGEAADWPAARWLALVGRQWPVILATAILAVLVAAALQLLSSPVYESRATLLVRFGREYAYRPEVGDGWTWTPSSLDTAVNTEVRILAADDLKRAVVAAIGPELLYPDVGGAGGGEGLAGWARHILGAAPRPSRSPLDRATARLDRDLAITASREASIIDLSYRNADPALATRVLQQLLEAAAKKRRLLYAEIDPATIDAQLAGARAAVAAAEQALLDFRQSSQLYDLEEQLAAAAKESGELAAAVAASERRLAALQAAVAALEARLRTLLGDPALFTAAEPAAVREAEQRLLERQIADAALMAGIPDTSYLASLLRGEVEKLRDAVEQMRGQREQGLSAEDQTAYRQLAADRSELRGTIARVTAERTEEERRLEAASRRLAALQALKPRLDDLQSDVAHARAAYDGFAAKAADRSATAILDKSGTDNLRLAEPPGPPASPAGSSAALRIAVAGLLGALAGAAIALWRERGPGRSRRRAGAAADGSGRAGVL